VVALVAALLLLLVGYGGALPYSRESAALLGVAALLALSWRPHQRLPRGALLAIACLTLPAAALACLQALPLGIAHPWTEADRRLLGELAGTARWSLHPQASWTAAAWALALGGVATACAACVAGHPTTRLPALLVLLAAMHAWAALPLAALLPGWPSELIHAHRVHGSFVNPNQAAAYWAAWLPLAIVLALGRRRNRWRLAAVGLALAVVFSASRGAILAALLVGIPFGWRLLPQGRRLWWGLGTGGAFLALLLLIGLGPVSQRFAGLSAEVGPGVAGRLHIWRSSTPLALDAGPLGSGAGTTRFAWRRLGDVAFDEREIDHLHNDPLEWLLEYGWLGSAITLAGLIAAVLVFRSATAPSSEQSRLTAMAAGAGLLYLAIHGCVDFIWHREAVSLSAALLVGILIGKLPPRSGAAPPRWPLLFWAAAITAATMPTVPWVGERQRAERLDELLHNRRRQNLPLQVDRQLDAVLAQRHRTPELELARSRLAIHLLDAGGDDQHRAQARDALTALAGLRPASAAAWIERARLLDRSPQTPARMPAMMDSLKRWQAWAPAWRYGQHHALLLFHRHRQALQPDELRPLLIELLALPQARPSWFFELVAGGIGREQTVRLLLAGPTGPRLASAERWLRHRAGLERWLAAWRRSSTAQTGRLRLAPDQFALLPALDITVPVEVPLPNTPAERRRLAATLHDAGLPLPPGLEQRLERDGSPWRWWCQEPDLLDAEQREALRSALASQQHEKWGRRWRERVRLAEAAFAGRAEALDAHSDPRLLLALREQAPSETVGARAGALLLDYRRPRWQDLRHGRWSWLLTEGARPTLVRLPAWTGVVIDGRWRGWRRGFCDLTALAGTGLHRIALIDPPALSID